MSGATSAMSVCHKHSVNLCEKNIKVASKFIIPVQNSLILEKAPLTSRKGGGGGEATSHTFTK